MTGRIHSKFLYDCRSSTKVNEDRFPLGVGENNSLNKLKELISQSRFLRYLNFSNSFVVYSGASDVGIETVFMKERERSCIREVMSIIHASDVFSELY